MKLLTFLGTARYSETTYTWQGKEYTARFAPVAACHFLQPQSVTVFLTEKAEQDVFADFQAAMPAGVELQRVPVPLGADERELWQVFGQLSSAVSPGEEVAFDITHGLRSSPLLGLLAAAFLRAGVNVSLKAVLYGAYDVGQQVSPGRTPLFDLSPLLALLEWAYAADHFKRTGDARLLAALLKQQQKTLALAAEGDRMLLGQAGSLGNLAGALTSISQSLQLIRPYRAMAQVAILPEYIEDARAALERSAPARPFGLLLADIASTYAPLARRDPEAVTDLKQTLEVERTMIRWCAERDLWVQAVSLAREWVVSWVMYHLGLTRFSDQSSRERVESVMGAEAKDFVTSKEKGQPFTPLFLARVPEVECVLALWNPLTQARNDTLHAGKRAEPVQPQALIKQIEHCLATIETLPL